MRSCASSPCGAHPASIFDVGSLKSPLRAGLLALKSHGCKVTSLHPMFGPDTELLSGRHVIFVDLGSAEALASARELFAPTMAEQVVMSLDDHDRLIAYVLGLSHALNIAFFTALAESGEAAPKLARMSSTTFDSQLDVATRVAQESPDLYYEIQSLNDYGAESLEALSKAVERIRTAVIVAGSRRVRRADARGRDYLEDRRSVTERACLSGACNRPGEYGGLTGNARPSPALEARTPASCDWTRSRSRRAAMMRCFARLRSASSSCCVRARSRELLRRLIHGLRDSYQLDSVTLLLHDPNHEIRHLLSGDGFLLEELREVQFVDSLLNDRAAAAGNRAAVAGALPVPRITCCCCRRRVHTGSLALIPLRRNEQLDGVLDVLQARIRFRFTRELATRLSRAPRGRCRDLPGKRGQPRAAGAQRTDGLSDRASTIAAICTSRLCEELARAQRDQRPMACLMIDVDHFKRINDEYGHLAGDAVLREVARRMDAEMRLSDTGARFGGDEFAIVAAARRR